MKVEEKGKGKIVDIEKAIIMICFGFHRAIISAVETYDDHSKN